MSAPQYLLVITGLLALSAYIFRRRPRIAAAVASVGAAMLAAFTLLASLDEPFIVLGAPLKLASEWSILGRSIILDEGNRAAVGFLYFVGAFIFGGGWLARPSRSFYTVGLVSLGVVAASLMVQPFLYAAIFLELAAMGAVLLLVSPEAPNHRGPLRLLVFYTFGMMAILMAGWMLESAGVTDATPDLAFRATILLAIGFAVLMAVPPFHLWLPAAASESNPYALAFVTIILQSAGVFFLLRFLDTYSWLRDDLSLFAAIRWAGMVMVFLGSIWALVQRSLSKTMAYALLTDFGVMLLAVSANVPEGYRLALGLTGVRMVSLTVWALGLARMLNRSFEREELQLEGAAHRSPLAAIAVLVGMLSIAGFPLTAGFPSRWALLSTLAQSDPLAGGAILSALILISAAVVRWAGILLSRPQKEERWRPTLSEWFLVGGGIVLCLLLGAFPQIIYPWIVEAAAGMTQLLP